MLPSASALACRGEERVQKAFSVDHHGPGDARLSHSASRVYGAKFDYVADDLAAADLAAADDLAAVTAAALALAAAGAAAQPASAVALAATVAPLAAQPARPPPSPLGSESVHFIFMRAIRPYGSSFSPHSSTCEPHPTPILGGGPLFSRSPRRAQTV